MKCERSHFQIWGLPSKGLPAGLVFVPIKRAAKNFVELDASGFMLKAAGPVAL